MDPPGRPSSSTSWPTTRSEMLPRLNFTPPGRLGSCLPTRSSWLVVLPERRVLGLSSSLLLPRLRSRRRPPPRSLQQRRSPRSRQQRPQKPRSQLQKRLPSLRLRPRNRLPRSQLLRSLLLRSLLPRRLLPRRSKSSSNLLLETTGPFQDHPNKSI